MARAVIAIDVDDVLAGANQAMMHYINEHFGTNHTWEDYTVAGPYHRYWEKVVWQADPVEGAKRYRAFIGDGTQRRMPVIQDALEVIEYLKKHYELVVITARDHEYMDDTHHWLQKHFPQTFKGVHFLPYKDDGVKKVHKAVVARELGVKYLIDDAVEHCVPAAAAGIKCLLFGDYGWNKDAELTEGITRVKNWKAVQRYFEETAK